MTNPMDNPTDDDLFEFLESWTTLSYTVKVLNVLGDGYEFNIVYEGQRRIFNEYGPYSGATYKEAVTKAYHYVGKHPDF